MSDSQNSGSARKSLVELFRNSEKMPMAVVESAPQAILSIDRTGRIVFANRRSEEIFGYRHEELLGAPVEMLLPQFERRGQAHANAPGGKERFELTARRHDGQEFPAEVSLSHIETEEGDFSIAFVGDIGHRRRLEEQSLQGQKMDATGRLAGCVAHDFNNMLTVIAGYNRMMLDELSPNDPLRSYAEEILRAADRASAITHQLLTFSRRQLARPRVIRLNEVVTQAEQMLRHLSGEKVRLQLRLAADTGSIQADPVHVEQAIVNLAQNGRDAMPQGGELIIETDNVHLDDDSLHTNLGMSQPGEFVMLSVTDTGHGMDAETRGRIFEPFFTTKEKGRGAGLGLATVYGIVRQAGGDIWVYTEPGRGSTFKLYFPLVAGSTESHEPRNAPARVVDPAQTILLVEDEKAVRELTLTMLRQLGYSVLAAESGGHALRISEGHGGEIALLVTDVVMPGMSGRQLADALMIVRPGMRVLFLSGYTENTVVHHGVLGAGVDFLPKPFSREVLGKKLREILSR